jgi:DNA invertase Pin-like site-specific DNA recombinase
MRCAIYARFSTNMQRAASIEDQIRQCRVYAAQQGEYEIVENYVRYDKALSGATTRGRDGLQFLIDAAKQEPRSFDVVLVDDTSRLARNTEDSLRTVAIFQFYGVAVVSVSQGIYSRQKSARQLLTLHAMIDEQYIVGVADKVHRGQEGRVLQGLVTGGRCYGYNNVPIEDPTKMAKYGRPAVVGVRAEIDQEQAAVVNRIFTLCAEGMSLAQMAKKLNGEGILAPQPPRSRKQRAWATSSIREILYNERYRGVLVWNRTKKERNPETGKKVSRPRPEAEWKRIEVPEWRIVSEDLWKRAHESFAERKRNFSATSLASGVSKSSTSKYLFSGLLVCGECGSKLVIVSGDGKRGYKKYGCPSHGYRGTCSNGVFIRQDRLEDQLLSYIESEILTNEMAAYTVGLFEQELNKRLDEMAANSENYTSAVQKLRAERDEIKAEAERLVNAIAAAGHSAMLLKRLAEAEEKIATIEARIEARRPPDVKRAVAEVREYAYKAIFDMKSLFRAVTQKAKVKLAQHIKELVLTPKQRDGDWIYEVTGDWELLPEKKCVILMVARDGIVPQRGIDNT